MSNQSTSDEGYNQTRSCRVCGNQLDAYGKCVSPHAGTSPKPPKTNLEDVLDDLLQDLIYDTPNHYGYPPDYEPDFKKARTQITNLFVSQFLEVLPEERKQVIKTYSSPLWTSGKYCGTCGSDIKENTTACGCTDFNKCLAQIKDTIGRFKR